MPDDQAAIVQLPQRQPCESQERFERRMTVWRQIGGWRMHPDAADDICRAWLHQEADAARPPSAGGR